ncbi:M23 family metallopeptidase [Halonatronum saccharophilum]|uniref:M23 family metallopeptidase n=1 Tax=Halonatronum saccharophilum TaxID=150060 RepID=UPI0006872C18|nr:M23 family metallopeptidase [Halonatronum saccharophilum]
MNRDNMFSNLKKLSKIVLVLLMVLTVIERIMYPPQDLVNITRLLLITVFLITALALPWLKNAGLFFKSLGLIGIILYTLGFLVLDSYTLIVIAILIGILMFIFSTSFESVKDGNEKNEDKENEFFPQQEPTERAGETKILVKYYISVILSFFNPFQFFQMIKQIVGSICLSELENFQQKKKYTLPFADEWLVLNGGIEKKDSHSWDVVNQRYAYDLVVSDSNNRQHKNNGDNLKDYYCYGKNILSPEDGEVIKVKDGIRDCPHPGTIMIDFLAKDFRGNFVIIKYEEKEYSFMAHFIPGSFKVKKGDYVKRGEIIGKCGN